MKKTIKQRTIETDLAWLAHLGEVRRLEGDRLYHVTLADGTTATAKFYEFTTLTVRAKGKTKDFDYMPLEDTEIVKAFITAAEGL